MGGKRRRCSSTIHKRGKFPSSPSRHTRWRPTGKKQWKSAATGIWPSPASRARSSRKCNASSGKAMEARREEPARILIVDDHEDNVELLKARLESWGYGTESAADGEEALQKVESA